MYKKSILLIFLFTLTKTFAQSNETCDTPNDTPVLDLNSITKCSIQDSKDKKTKKVKVQVSTRRRVVRKRDAVSGVVTNDYTHKLASVKKKAAIVNSIDVENSKNIKVIPFNYVEEIPLFKKCERVALSKQDKCFKQAMNSHVKKHFKYPANSFDDGIQGRVLVQFTINTDGTVGKMNIITPYKGEELGDEARRIISKLPKFIPAKHSGVKVPVKYGLPITFKIPGVARTNIRTKKERANIVKTEVFEFSNVDQLPKFKTCKASSLDCFAQELVKHIQNNFAYPEKAVNENIEGRVNISFIINTRGEVVNVVAKGANNGKILEESAISLVGKLPDFIPAVKNGKNVNTKYTFPIDYKLDE